MGATEIERNVETDVGGHFRERVDDHIFPLWRHPGVTVMLKSRASHAEQMGARTRRNQAGIEFDLSAVGFSRSGTPSISCSLKSCNAEAAVCLSGDGRYWR